MRRLLITALLLVSIPASAHAYPRTVTRWTPTIRAAAVHEHLSRADTRWLLHTLPGIIARENGGGERSKAWRRCVGLLQLSPSFAHRDRGWSPGHSHHDARQCGRCSIYRLAWGFRHSSGRAWVRATWRATLR